MEFKHIASGMVIILIGLFAYEYFSKDREKNISTKEANYYEGLNSFKSGNMTKDQIIELAIELMSSRGQNEDAALSMVENDLNAFSNS